MIISRVCNHAESVALIETLSDDVFELNIRFWSSRFEPLLYKPYPAHTNKHREAHVSRRLSIQPRLDEMSNASS